MVKGDSKITFYDSIARPLVLIIFLNPGIGIVKCEQQCEKLGSERAYVDKVGVFMLL